MRALDQSTIPVPLEVRIAREAAGSTDLMPTHTANLSCLVMCKCFHPAGHVLGSAQIRIDDGDAVWVITGDYKRDPDPTCQRFEPIHCDVLITEATFALPIYRWPSMDQVMEHMFRWWDHHIRNQRTPVLLCYSLGKAQRIMAEIRQRSDRSVRVHGAVANLNLEYENQGVALCPWRRASESDKGVSTDLVIAPPQVAGSSFLKRFHPTELAMASGWMQVRRCPPKIGHKSGVCC